MPSNRRHLEQKNKNILQVDKDFIGKVLKNQAGYINKPIQVPLYQRPYTWKKVKVQQLFDDLIEHFESEVDNAYYLGQLVFVIKETRPEILDGQQRLTTFYVFISALANSFEKLKNEIRNVDMSGDEKQAFFNEIDEEIEILFKSLINREERNMFVPHYDDDQKHFAFLLNLNV